MHKYAPITHIDSSPKKEAIHTGSVGLWIEFVTDKAVPNDTTIYYMKNINIFINMTIKRYNCKKDSKYA